MVVLGMILLIDSRINGVILRLKQDIHSVYFWVLENSSILVTKPGEDKRMSFLLNWHELEFIRLQAFFQALHGIVKGGNLQ